VRIAIVEWLAPGARQRLRLGLPLDFAGAAADALDVHVRLHATAPAGVTLGDGLEGAALTSQGAGADVTLHRDGWRKTDHRALDVAWPAPQGDTLLRERVDGQGYFHAELQVPDPPAARAKPNDLTLIWDASGSGAQRDHDAELRLLAALFAWQPDVTVRLRVVRDAAEPDRMFDVRHGDWQALRDTLVHIAYDGASNASLWAAPATRAPQTSLALLFSDGLGNWGGAASTVRADMPAYAVQASGSGSAVYLRQWAEARGGQLLDLAALRTDEALRQIRQRGTRLVRVDGEGFDQVALASTRPDAGRLVLAGRFTAASAKLDLVLESGDGTQVHKAIELAAPGLGDSVDELLAQPDLHRTEIAALGDRFGIVTPETSLIVLETLADYQRYELLPPPGSLRDAYDDGLRAAASAKAARSAQHLASLVERYRAVQAWWDTDFPKDMPAPQDALTAPVARIVGSNVARNAAREMATPPMPSVAMPVPMIAAAAAPAAPAQRWARPPRRSGCCSAWPSWRPTSRRRGATSASRRPPRARGSRRSMRCGSRRRACGTTASATST